MAMTTDRDVDGVILPFPAPPSGSMGGRTMRDPVHGPLPAAPRLPDHPPGPPQRRHGTLVTATVLVADPHRRCRCDRHRSGSRR